MGAAGPRSMSSISFVRLYANAVGGIRHRSRSARCAVRPPPQDLTLAVMRRRKAAITACPRWPLQVRLARRDRFPAGPTQTVRTTALKLIGARPDGAPIYVIVATCRHASAGEPRVGGGRKVEVELRPTPTSAWPGRLRRSPS